MAQGWHRMIRAEQGQRSVLVRGKEKKTGLWESGCTLIAKFCRGSRVLVVVVVMNRLSSSQ